MKPAETGCEPGPDGRPHASDAERLLWFAGRSDPVDTVCPFRLRDPLAPALAARREGVDLDLDHIASLVTRFAAGCEVGLVEGAGGLLVPLAGRATLARLGRQSQARAIQRDFKGALLSRSSLGLTPERSACKALPSTLPSLGTKCGRREREADAGRLGERSSGPPAVATVEGTWSSG